MIRANTSKLINKAINGTIDDRDINTNDNLNLFQKTENLNLAISSAKSIGCVVVGVNPQALLDLKQHIILGMIWQVIRVTPANDLGALRPNHHIQGPPRNITPQKRK